MSTIKLKYNISCWNSLGLNYWGVTKCGNTSIKHSLILSSNLSSLHHKDDKHGTDSWVHDEKNVSYIDIKTALSNGNTNFTVVRNPYDRFISMYKDTQRRPNHFFRKYKNTRISSVDDLLSFIERFADHDREIHFRSQCYFLEANYNILPTVIFDVEDAESIEKFLNTKIERMNSINTQIQLNENQKQKVFRIYQKDFKLLGYEQ
jgi:hypothetical protein